jgi:hypothetical protein
MSIATARNIIIILALAAAVAILPGGGTGAAVVLEAVSLAFLAAVGWVASLIYREHRGSLYLLGDSRRALLYGAATVLAVTLTATSRLTGGSLGSVVWLVLVGASLYVGGTVIWAARRY